jgi:hypothetical protein
MRHMRYGKHFLGPERMFASKGLSIESFEAKPGSLNHSNKAEIIFRIVSLSNGF